MNKFDVTAIVANFNDAEKVSIQLSRICESSMVIVAHHRTLTKNVAPESDVTRVAHQIVIRDVIDIAPSDNLYYRLCSNKTCIKSRLVIFSPKALEKIKNRDEYKFTVNQEKMSINDSYCLLGEKEFYHLKEKIIGFNSHKQYDRIEDLMNLLKTDDIL